MTGIGAGAGQPPTCSVAPPPAGHALARHLHRVQFTLSALAALPAGLAAAPDQRWSAALVAAVLAVPVLLALMISLELALASILDPRHPRRTAGSILHQLWGEWRASLIGFYVQQSPAARFPEPDIRHDPARPAILLVHGYLCNRAVWRPLLASGHLDEANVATLNLAPVFVPIEAHFPRLAQAIEALRQASGAGKVILVCHSMGGLLARAYLLANPEAPVGQLITIATPHAGSRLARLARGASAPQMVPGSKLLRRIAAGARESLQFRLTCLASRDDNLVLPRSSLVVAGSIQCWFEGLGHLQMLRAPEVHLAVAQALAHSTKGVP